MNVLVPNLGSTSLKYQLIEFPSERVLARGRRERITDYRDAVEKALAAADSIDAVGFKAVHAGPDYRGTFLIDDDLLAALETYSAAAPLHNRIYLTGIGAFRELRPDLPLVAVLEPGFHTTIPDRATTYGVPAEWREKHGVRRYGFHGSSHRFISRRVPEFLGCEPSELRIVSCHLGGSASMCAIKGGKSLDTSMGFSPQSGFQNATRNGELDVFAALYMMDLKGWSTSELREQLLSNSGLTGISGVAGGDVRDIEEAADSGSAAAALALDVFAYEVRKTIGAYAAAMGGIDAVAFTAGIGENSARIRAMVCEGLGFLGIRIDPVHNVSDSGDRVISYHDAPVKVLVLETNEELIVARETASLLAG